MIEFSNIITLAHTVGKEEFNDLSFEDANELLVDIALSENEIIVVVLETLDLKEQSVKDEDPVLNKDLIKDLVNWPVN
ncbi:hypothetical protein TNCV_712801 [Trichonephila clavipes]|nr:hypothetical protein TNCV_712801 [Trichonephila clavipes]